jgi:hypothetical protein
MPERSTEITALTVLVVAEIPNFWSGFLPSLFTIATFSKGDQEKMDHTKRWIRRGEIQAMGLSVALGVAAGWRAVAVPGNARDGGLSAVSVRTRA